MDNKKSNGRRPDTTQNTKDSAIQTPLKRGELRYSRKISNRKQTRQKQSRDTGDSGHKALNSEEKRNKNNPETQATLGIKLSTAKTNETKTIQRHRRHWA
jgi:hypothetical protein